MLKISNVEIHGFYPAIRGMRNPMNSWDRIDSAFPELDEDTHIGSNDLDLMKRLFHGGTEHRKFMRMISVYMDVEAPLYWWKEYDTYKVGTVANSCSTMHKIHSRDLVMDDFSHDHLDEGAKGCLECTISNLNWYRKLYLETKDKEYWYNMIQLLPTSYMQKRTLMLNYEVCATIIRQRTGHKLDEWKTFVDTLKSLPYLMDIME